MGERNVITTEETPVKSRRGGKRPGSGRKPNYLKRLGVKAITAVEILAHHNEPELCPSKCDLGRAEKPCRRRKIQFRGYSPALASAHDTRVTLPSIINGLKRPEVSLETL